MTFPRIALDHIPDDDLRGIGLVSQAWAYLEGAIERICWLMADLQQVALGQALTTHMTHRSRYDAAMALVHSQFPDSEPHKALKALGNKITGELAGKRNDICHSRLHGLPEFGRPFRIVYKARGRVQKETVPVEIEEYDKVATEILETTNELINILNALIALLIDRDGDVPPWTHRP